MSLWPFLQVQRGEGFMTKVDLSQINFFSGEFKKKARPLYAELRKNHPVVPITMPTGHTAWVVTRYRDCVSVLKDRRFFKNPANIPALKSSYQDVYQDEVIGSLYTTMLNQDPPDHTRLRGIAHQAFTPKRIAKLESDIQNITKGLLDKLEEAKKFDLIEEFAFPLPIIVICDLLGIPKEDRDLFRKWSRGFIENQNDPEKLPLLRQAIVEIYDYLKVLFDDRRKNPKDDLVTALLQAEEDGEKLSETELYSTVYLLMAAGHETTVNLIANGVVALIENPDQFDQLKANLDLVPQAVEELLRYAGPVEISTDRFVGEDVEMHGQQLKTGDMVIAVLASANRDEQQFENPDQLDFTRKPNPHIAFGSGIHFCLGAPLARLEGKIAFTQLIQRMPNLQLTVKPEELELDNSLLMRAYKALPIRI